MAMPMDFSLPPVAVVMGIDAMPPSCPSPVQGATETVS